MIISEIFDNLENIRQCLQSGSFHDSEIEETFRTSLSVDDPEYLSWEWARHKIGNNYGFLPEPFTETKEVLPKYLELVDFFLS